MSLYGHSRTISLLRIVSLTDTKREHLLTRQAFLSDPRGRPGPSSKQASTKGTTTHLSIPDVLSPLFGTPTCVTGFARCHRQLPRQKTYIHLCVGPPRKKTTKTNQPQMGPTHLAGVRPVEDEAGWQGTLPRYNGLNCPLQSRCCGKSDHPVIYRHLESRPLMPAPRVRGGPIGQDRHPTCLALILRVGAGEPHQGLVGDATASDRVVCLACCMAARKGCGVAVGGRT